MPTPTRQSRTIPCPPRVYPSEKSESQRRNHNSVICSRSPMLRVVISYPLSPSHSFQACADLVVGQKSAIATPGSTRPKSYGPSIPPPMASPCRNGLSFFSARTLGWSRRTDDRHRTVFSEVFRGFGGRFSLCTCARAMDGLCVTHMGMRTVMARAVGCCNLSLGSCHERDSYVYSSYQHRAGIHCSHECLTGVVC